MESQTVKPSLTTSNVVPSDQDQVSLKGKWRKRLFNLNKEDWMEDMRGNLSMVATLIAAITFQAALNPPGGVVQASTAHGTTLFGCNDATNVANNITDGRLCTGAAVLPMVSEDNYLLFLIFNSLSFVGSLSAALLLVSGVPLRNRPLMWFLSLLMSASLAFLALTYLYGVLLLMPKKIYREARKIIATIMWVWSGLLMCTILLSAIYFVFWCAKLYKSLKKKRNTSANQEINQA